MLFCVALSIMVAAQSSLVSAGSTMDAADSKTMTVTGNDSNSSTITIEPITEVNKTDALSAPMRQPSSEQRGTQARVASSYLASRAATGLQLKQRSSTNQSTKPQSATLMGDPVGLDVALDSQMDLQTAAGEHKYILVKKKPKHKKIKMEVYKPKMKYKKIKMKVPVKKLKKKKVKGYLVKKEKHHY